MGIALFSILLSIYLFFGFYVLSINYRQKINQLFFLICVCFAFVCLGSIFIQSQITDAYIQKWIKFCIILYHFTWYLALLFYINLTRIIRASWYVYLVLIIPISYLAIKIVLKVSGALEYTSKDGIRYFTKFGQSLSEVINTINIVTLLYLLLSIIVLVISAKKTVFYKNRRQIIIILITQILSVVLIFCDHIALFYWFGILTSRIPGMAQVYSLLWIFGIWYAMVKYRFLAVTPAMISQDILSSIDECIILLDTDQKIISVNNKASAVFNKHENYINTQISGLIENYNNIKEEIKNLKMGIYDDFACRLNFVSDKNEPVLMDVKFKPVRDKYHDLIGILIIAREVREIKQLKDIYKITDREAAVIQAVISGKTNHEIAAELKIAERTVKAHLTNIFNKLVVDNKMQLVMLLKEYNLLPEKQSDKLLFSRL